MVAEGLGRRPAPKARAEGALENVGLFLFGASADDQRTGYVHNPVPTDEVAAECHRVYT